MSSGDFSRFVERCYDHSPPFDGWIAGLAPVMALVVTSREGILVSGGELAHSPSAASACGRAEILSSRIAQVHDDAPPGFTERAYRPFLVTSLSRQFGLRGGQPSR